MKHLLIILSLFFGTYVLGQDIIFLKNGEEIKAKVLEILTNEVKYKKFSNLKGPTYSLLKSEIFKIKYPNGDQDVFKSEPASANTSSNTQENHTNANSNTNNENSNSNNETAVINPLLPNTSDNSNESNALIQQQQNATFKYQASSSFELLHSELQKINSSANKDEILKLVQQLEDTITRDDLKKAWEIQAEIDKLN